MKKIIFCALVFFTSCSSVDPQISDVVNSKSVDCHSQAVEMLQLQSKVDSLNRTMFPVDNNQTRGLGNFFKKFFSVVLCDAVGGLFGNLGGPCGAAAGAVMMSATAAFVPADNINFSNGLLSSSSFIKDKYNQTNSKVNLPNVSLKSSVVPKYDPRIKPGPLDSIGYYHNKALIELNNIANIDKVNVDTLIFTVAETTCRYYNKPKQEVVAYLNNNKDMFDEVLISKSLMAKDSTSLHSAINVWKEHYPEQSDKLNVLETFFEGISNLNVDENDGDYFNRVLELISTSSLDEDTKQSLRNAIIVGNASYQLWNTDEL